MNDQSMDITNIHRAYRSGELTPEKLIDDILLECSKYSEHNIWIRLLERSEIQTYLDYLADHSIDELPLYGIPFAIKDNIELAGFPVTAGCEAYSYTPSESAYVVKQLIQAGAIPIGKTNLDQFATGLVGVRSPEQWGACRNSFDKEYISGGSSSGSAVAVSLGLVSFSLGTDTAGSGRVPAAFNNLIGLKPTKGLLSTTGVVPACRSLDCVSIFSLTANDANRVFSVAAKFDPKDAYARPNIDTNTNSFGARGSAAFDFAIPSEQFLQFFGDQQYEQLFKQTVQQLEAKGGRCHVTDFEPFITAAKLLYEGPWVAERRVATAGVDRGDMLPVIQAILASQEDATAEDLFRAEYALQECRQQVNPIIEEYDFILTPTAGTIYKVHEVQDNPIELNSNLGYYTNFMNLLDFSAVAVPAGFNDLGLPFGVTLFSRAFSDNRLLSYANLLQSTLNLKMGATAHQFEQSSLQRSGTEDRTLLAVCGAHLDGQPLNWQLTSRKGKLIEKTTTSKNYRLFALSSTTPSKPGLVRSEAQGEEIEVEVWSLPTSTLGSFLTEIPSPLGLGKVEVSDGRWVTGFICEPFAIASAQDITAHQSWRQYLSNT